MRFYIRKKDGKESAVHYQLSLSRKMKVRGSTGIMINPKWTIENEEIKTTVTIPFPNRPDRGIKNLREVERSLFNFIDFKDEKLKELIKSKTKDIDKKLKDEFDIYFDRKIDFKDSDHKNLFQFIDFLIETKKGSVGVATIDTYKKTKSYLKEYEREFKTSINYENINQGFYNRFVNFLRDNKGFSDGYIGKLIKNIRTFMNASHVDGHHTSLKHKGKDFKILKGVTNDIYLNEDELNTLKNHKVSGRFEAVRDYFLLMSYTGLRVGDVLSLKKSDIITYEGERMISYNESKNDVERVFDITPEVEVVLKRWKYGFPNDVLENKIHKNYINRDIKMIAQECRLSKAKRISSHTGRRSYCTNSILNNVPIYKVMRQSGHRTQSILFDYVKASGPEVVNKLNKRNDLREH